MPVYQDGLFPSGAPVITINNVAYKANSFVFPQTSDSVVNIPDNSGLHSGALAFTGPLTGTAEVQLATNTTVLPTTAAQNSTTGTFIVNNNGTNVNVFVTAVTVTKPTAAPWTASLTFQARAN